MSKTSVEFELLAPSREKPGGQQQQYPASRWPYDVVDPIKCEFEYSVFRDAYNRYERTDEIADGIYRSFPRLTDAELRMRWLDHYVCYKTPSQQQIDGMAYEASRGKPAALKNVSPEQVVALLALALLIAMFLL